MFFIKISIYVLEMEVLLATLLFILLSPGLIFTIPPGKGGILSGENTSNVAVLVHAVIFFIVQKMTVNKDWPFDYLNDAVAEIKGLRPDGKPSTSGSIVVAPLVATLLFIVLSPGLLVTLPPDEGALFMSEDTNILAILVHGIIYFIGLKYWNDGLKDRLNKDGSLDLDASGKTQRANGIIGFLNEQFNSI